MLDLLLPRHADNNNFRGHKAALWLLGLLVFVKVGINLGSIFNGYTAASSADGIPLDTYSPAAAQTVLSLFALLGISRLMLCVVCVVALVRYRALVPLMFALMLLEQLSRRLALEALPIARAGTPPVGVINLALLALMVLGLGLSLWPRDESRAP